VYSGLASDHDPLFAAFSYFFIEFVEHYSVRSIAYVIIAWSIEEPSLKLLECDLSNTGMEFEIGPLGSYMSSMQAGVHSQPGERRIWNFSSGCVFLDL
jgi:hypothetical protein